MKSLSNILKLGRLKVNNSRGKVQVESHSGEVHSNVLHPSPHGLESKAPVGSKTYTLAPAGDPDNEVVLLIAGEGPVSLSAGDTVVYSDSGAYIHVNAGAEIIMSGAVNVIDGATGTATGSSMITFINGIATEIS